MRRYILAMLIATGALAVSAPVASAQPNQQPLTVSYMIKIVGPAGHNPPCPGVENVCGRGIDPTFGALTYGAVFTDTGFTATLTFTTGVLVIDETFQQITPTSNSSSAHGVENPLTALLTWSVDPTSSGAFSGATGNGTDIAHVAGEQGKGVIAGLVNLP